MLKCIEIFLNILKVTTRRPCQKLIPIPYVGIPDQFFLNRLPNGSGVPRPHWEVEHSQMLKSSR